MIILFVQVIFDVNLPWTLATIILTGRLPGTELSVGFAGTMIILITAGLAANRFFGRAKIDLYQNAINEARVATAKLNTNVLEDSQSTADELAEEDLELVQAL